MQCRTVNRNYDAGKETRRHLNFYFRKNAFPLSTIDASDSIIHAVSITAASAAPQITFDFHFFRLIPCVHAELVVVPVPALATFSRIR